MSGLRGFGFVMQNGVARFWYVDHEGVKRWVSNDKPVEASA